MKIFKKIIFNTLCITLAFLLFLACDFKESTRNNEAVIKLESNTKTSAFFMENDETLIVSAILENDKTYDSEIVWKLFSSDINGNIVDKSDCLTELSYDKVLIKLKALSFLGDYTLRAKTSFSEATYNFTLNSTKELENALSYSFVSIDSINEDETGKQDFTEYSIFGKKLSSAKERSLLGKSLSYAPSISSLLFITSTNDELGELSIENDSNFYISRIGNNSLLLSPKENNKTVSSLKIYAGTKKEKNVDVELLDHSPLDIKEPVISKERPHKKSGVILSVTADNVSTPYYSFDGGYSLDIKVKRAINNEEPHLILPTSTINEKEWKTTEDEYYIKAIEYGYELYLPYYGKYTVDAKTVTITGESKTSSYSFEVLPYSTRDKITTNIIQSKKNVNWLSESINELNKNGSYKPTLSEKAKITIPSNIEGTPLLFIDFTSATDNTSYNKKREILQKGQTLSFKDSGQYYIYITSEDVGEKIGNIKDEEYINETSTFSSFFTINDNSEQETISVLGNVVVKNGYYNYEYTIKDDNEIVKNYTIYARLLKRKGISYTPIEKSIGHFFSNNDTILEKGKTYTASVLFSDINTEDDIKLAIYICPKNPLYTEGNVRLMPLKYNSKVEYSEAVPLISILNNSYQDTYNACRIGIYNVKDETSANKTLYYSTDSKKSLDNKPWNQFYTNLVKTSSFKTTIINKIYFPDFTYYITEEARTIYIKAVNANKTHTVYTSFTVPNRKLTNFKNGELFATYGRHGAPYKNEMLKVKIENDKDISYGYVCFRMDGVILERLVLYYDYGNSKWMVIKTKDDYTQEIYDATIEDGWWVAKNFHQLYIYKTEQYFGVYKAKKGYFPSDIAYSYSTFEGNSEDNNNYCSIYKTISTKNLGYTSVNTNSLYTAIKDLKRNK